ncbi:MAG: hypothetical protein ACJ75T_02445 [Solirubrobacterales bacterium]
MAEDNIPLRETWVRILGTDGVDSLPVSSYSQAVKALKLSPELDVALLDVHLDPDPNRENKGGIEIAELLRKTSPHTRIIGYTSEGTLAPAESQYFDITMAKGSLTREDHQEMWELCTRFARESFASRQNETLKREDLLRRDYEREVTEGDVIRLLHADDPNLADEYTAEGELGLAGYRIKVITVPLPEEERESRPFPLWEQHVYEDDQDWVNLEVYGHPRLFASGRSEMEALEFLAAFIGWTRDDLAQHPTAAAEDAPFKRFVESLYAR